MASPFFAIACALVGAGFWTALGYGVARRAGLEPALAMAPGLGWAMHTALSVAVLRLTGFSAVAVLVLGLGMAAIALYAAKPSAGAPSALRLPAWAYVLAAGVSAIPALALLPKHAAHGVILAGPIFDHAKVAIIDEIARGNLPPLNPFFFETGYDPKLVYYWAWYASAAQLSAVTGATGWEADIALSWFTGFASLTLMMGLAVWLCGRPGAAGWVAALSLASSLRPVLVNVFGPKVATTLLSPEAGFGTWINHMPWVPQHMAGATCAVLAVLLISRTAARRDLWAPAALGLAAAAGVGCSAYIGGFVFAVAALLVGVTELARGEDRVGFLVRSLGAVALAGVLAFPALADQAGAVAARSQPTVVLDLFKGLGAYVPAKSRAALDPAAFWLLVFVVEWPAIYLPGWLAVTWALVRRKVQGERRSDAISLALLALSGLAVTYSLKSVIGNNDLGWRAVIPTFFVLTAFAAAGLAHWFRGRLIGTLCIVLFAAGLPSGMEYVRALVEGVRAPSAPAFAKAPALWEAVRRHAGPQDRVANNPLYLHDITPWPTNISWALLANRRSCYAVWEMVTVYSPLSPDQAYELAQVYNRAFAGTPAPDDLLRMATRNDCRVALVTPQDGAWDRDPFATSPHYGLAEAMPEWRIYVRR